MKKLKDFFYDKNDIFIVLIIVAVAAFVIYTSINSIMAYPEQYASEMAAKQQTEIEETSVDVQPSTDDEAQSTDSSDEEN